MLDVERAHEFHLAKVAMEVGKNLEYAENDLVRAHGCRPPVSSNFTNMPYISTPVRQACLLLRRVHATTATESSNTVGFA